MSNAHKTPLTKQPMPGHQPRKTMKMRQDATQATRKNKSKTQKTKSAQARAIGIAAEKRRYDLPLSKSAGTGFLQLLIMLMSVLAILGTAASIALAEMTERWSSGLENKITIEIPAEDADGVLLPHDTVMDMTRRTAQILGTHPAMVSVVIMQDDDIKDLVSPWLGTGLAIDAIPMPGLISAEIQDGASLDLDALATRLRSAAPLVRIDTHETWLGDVLRFTGALQLAAILLTLTIAITTIVAVAGAVRSRISEYHEEVELLHLMGASDNYITAQFQKHTLSIAFQGALVGIVIGSVILTIIGWISGQAGVALLPEFRLELSQKLILATMPLLIAILAAATARWTVLRNLAKMP